MFILNSQGIFMFLTFSIGVCKKEFSAFSYLWNKKSNSNSDCPRLITKQVGSVHATTVRVPEQDKDPIPSWLDIEVLESVHKVLNPPVTGALSGVKTCPPALE